MRFRGWQLIVASFFWTQLGAGNQLNLPNQVSVNRPLSDDSDFGPKVRIGLQIIPMQKIFPKKDPRQKPSFVPGSVFAQTLRASMGRTNHFFVQGYHISTEPVEFLDPTTSEQPVESGMQVKIRLNLAKIYGKNQDLEEDLGAIEVVGTLEGQDDLFALQGSTKKVFHNRMQEPQVTVVCGFKKQ